MQKSLALLLSLMSYSAHASAGYEVKQVYLSYWVVLNDKPIGRYNDPAVAQRVADRLNGVE